MELSVLFKVLYSYEEALLPCKLAGILVSEFVVTDDEPPQFKTVETWKCYSWSDYEKRNVLINLERVVIPPEADDELIDELEAGSVKVAGVEYPAIFLVEGFNRKWKFGQGEVGYMFMIEPDGTGAY